MQNNEEEKIELELPEGEVDIHAADVDDSVIEEIPVIEVKPKDELDEISDSVQKRIDKLTYKMREAERQRDEAVNYAQSVNQTAITLKEKLKNSDSSLFKEYDNRVQSEIEGAKIRLKEAQDVGDSTAVVNATEKLSRQNTFILLFVPYVTPPKPFFVNKKFACFWNWFKLLITNQLFSIFFD